MDLRRTLDTIDFFIDGTNVSTRAGPDAIFCITRDLLVAVRDLAMARREKVSVSFYEGPWELVALREELSALVSFMRVGAAPEVVVQDRPVELAEIGAAAVTAGEQLIRRARRIDVDLVSDPLIREIEVLGAEVRGALLALAPSSGGPTPVRKTHRTKNFEQASSSARLSFGFEITATSRDLLGPVTKGRADLHSLLVRGMLVAHAGSHRVVVGEGRVFLQVERLLTALKRLLGAWEQGTPMHVRLHGDTLQVGLRFTKDEKVSFTLGQVGGGRRVVTLAELSVEDVAKPFLALGNELRRTIKKLAPQQRHNPRFESYRRDLSHIESWYRDLTRPPIVAESAEAFNVPDQDEPDSLAVPAKVTLTETRRLSYLERWRLEAEGLDIGGTFLCGDRLVVTARDTVMALDRDRGELLWKVDAPPAFSLMAGHYGLVRLSSSGEVSLIDLRDGRTRWEGHLRPRAGSPSGAQVGGSYGPKCVVLSEAERGLVALDLNTGEQRWRFSAWRGREFSLRPAGRLLLVSCGDSSVYGIEAESGDLAWRSTARATFELQPTAFRDRVLVCGGPEGGREARIFCSDLASGRSQWITVLDLGVCGPIIGAAGHVVIVPGKHRSGGAVIVGLDLKTGQELWRRWLEGWSDYTLLAVDETIVACGAGGLVASIDARTGEINWSYIFEYTDPDDVPRRLEPVLRGGALFVPADTVYVLNPRDGKVIHRLGGDALVPDLLRVDERCGIYVAEEAGYVAAYGVAAQLAVVR